jgi:two-component system phosphate regulon sensor histidine kinase PhoR
MIKKEDSSTNYSRLRQFIFFISSLPWKHFKKTAALQMLISVFVMLVIATMARFYFKTYGLNQAREQLKGSLLLIRQSIETQKISPLGWCQSLKLNWQNRYTLLTEKGKVLCDSHLPPDKLPAEINFPEIREALEGNLGFNIRKSKSQNYEVMYGALTLKANYKGRNQTFVVRQTVSLRALNLAMIELDRAIIIFLIPFLFVTTLLSLWIYLQGSSPLFQIVKKVEKMKKTAATVEHVGDDDEDDDDFIPSVETDSETELSEVEQTLDRVQQNLEKYIDELYNENEKLNTVMRSISDSILAIGLNENILFANRQFRKNFISKEFRDQLLSKFKIWEVNRDIILHEQLKLCLETKEYVKKRKVHLPVKGGKRYRYFDLRINPLIDNKGEIFGAAGVLQDVSDQMLAEQMREDFVANVSHEVRTPLTALKGYVQIIKNAIGPEEKQISTYLEKVEQNSDRLTHLFSDILNLSVIESKQVIAKETVFVEEITKNVINNVKQGFQVKNIQIETRFDIEKTWANPQLLEQVITNLIENALKYTPDGGHVQIGWSQGSAGKYDVLTVSDSGYGIPKEHLPRLFERFYRVDHGRSRDEGGTGLGLAIVKHIVQIHNGRVSVNSEPENGTTFIVKLPAHYKEP